mgnify:CR=1 FL=1
MPEGAPQIAIDAHGAGMHQRVIISSDGAAARKQRKMVMLDKAQLAAWDAQKHEVMRAAMRAKYQAHPGLRALLLGTMAITVLSLAYLPALRAEIGWAVSGPARWLPRAKRSSPISGSRSSSATAIATSPYVLEPAAEMVTVVTPPNQVRVLGEDEVLEGGEALPGFRCVVRVLFE